MATPGKGLEPLRSLADRSRYSVWNTDKLRLADVDHQGHVNNAVHADTALARYGSAVRVV